MITDPVLDELQTIADRVVAVATDRDRAGDEQVEANVRVTRTRHGLTRFANSFVHQHVGEDTTSVSLTLAVDGRTATSTTTRIAPDELAQLVDDTLASARLQPVDPYWPGATPAAEAAAAGHLDAATADASPDTRAAEVRRFVDAAPDLRAAGFVDTEATWVAFASTAGQRVAGATSRATIDGIHQTDTSAGSAHRTSVRVADLDGAEAGALAADRARRSAQFVDLDPGTYPVVLGPEAVATVLVFLAVYGFNGKAHLEGGSFAVVGEQQLDRSLTIRVDPFRSDAITLPFDAEGTPRTTYALVEDGVTRALAHDRRTALRAGGASTGDALPGSASFGAVATTLVLDTNGPTTPAPQLLEGIERGLLVTQFHYVRVLDPKSAVATGLTRNGTFLVEDGQVVGAVGNLRFTQSLVGALGDGKVLAVGDDARYADSEFGPAMVIAPSLKLAGWTFTGGAKG